MISENISMYKILCFLGPIFQVATIVSVLCVVFINEDYRPSSSCGLSPFSYIPCIVNTS